MDDCQKMLLQKDDRNYGIDLLRIMSMFSIVLLHVLGEGGVGMKVEPFSKNYYGYLILRFLNEFAVDAFGMVSGYVMCRSKPRLSRLLVLWLQVMFYSVGLSALFILFDRSAVAGVRAELYSMLLPITGGRYWYMSSYFCLFFFIPVLNAGLEKLSWKEIRSVLIGLFVLICIAGSLNTSRKDPFSMNYGFSTAWLCVLYLIGGAYRKHGEHFRIRVWQSLLGIAVCVLVTVYFKHWMDMNRWRLPYTLDWMLMSNVSITYTLTGFFMLTLYARIRPCEWMKRIIRLLSPAALGVYLIHVHPLVWSRFITGRFAFWADLHWMGMLLGAVATAIGIFAVCMLIELCRIRLFRMLRLEKLCAAVGGMLERI